MPRTTKKRVGDKVFEVREKLPLQIIDKCHLRITKIEEEFQDNPLGRSEAMIEVRDWIFKKMVIRITIDGTVIVPGETVSWDDYLQNEADEDDWRMQVDLMEEFGKRMQEHYDQVKKKQTSSPVSNPEAPSVPGTPGTP